MFRKVTDQEEFRQLVRIETAVLVLFASGSCQVCHTLMPRLEAMTSQSFPRIAGALVDIGEASLLSAEKNVFTVPVILVFFHGQEFIRKSGSFSLAELQSEIDRLYRLILF